eukprot:4928-Pelagomonas_calceolata.AAC.1
MKNTLRASKSEVKHLKNRSCSPLPTFAYGNVALPQKDWFKHFGMLGGMHMTLKVSEEHAV